MSQSPLARSTRRTLPAFSHHPSRLSKSVTTPSLSEIASSNSPTQNVSASTGTDLHTPNRRDSTPTRYRASNGSNSTTPVTPKILYSPYATNSPHAGPSRSASIPFDMAASAKAAKRVQTQNLDSGTARTESTEETTSTRKKRFVRRKSLWQRIVALPETLIDRLVFDTPSSIMDILPPVHLANPIALGIHGIHYLLLAPLLAGDDEVYSILRSGREQGGVSGRWNRWEEEEHAQGRSIAGRWITFLFTLALFVIALSNTTYLFTRFKAYDMQLRSARDPVHSPNASPVPAPKQSHSQSQATDEDVFSASSNSISPQQQSPIMNGLKTTGHLLHVFIRFLYHATLSAIGKPADQSSTKFGAFGSSEDKIQSLRVWDPPEFCLAFFCAYPPTAPLLSYLLIKPHPFLTPFLHLTTTLLLAHLATSYAQLVKDKMFLSAEVMREYDQRFVYKRVFASRVDRSTQTNEAEMVW